MTRIKKIILGTFGIGLFLTVTYLQHRSQLQPTRAYQQNPYAILNQLHCDLAWNSNVPGCSSESNLAAVQDTGSPSSRCDCPGETNTSAGTWNNCLSCLYVTFIGIHNNLTRDFSKQIDMDSDLETSLNVRGTPMDITVKESHLSGYDRLFRISRTEGNICMNLHYAKKPKDPTRIKAIMHLNSAYCPSARKTGASAMAIKFDLKYSDFKSQKAHFFHTGEYEGNGFKITENDADDLFYMNLEFMDADGKRTTTGWAYRLAKGTGWKYYLNGEDNQLLYIATQRNLSFDDVNTGYRGLRSECVNDREDRTVDVKRCKQAGYGFHRFPTSVKAISQLVFPNWNVDNLNIRTNAKVFDYFNKGPVSRPIRGTADAD